MAFPLFRTQTLSSRLPLLRLPDSWFLMLVTVMLALTTFFVDRIVSSLPFWREINTRQINLALSRVVIEDYQHGALAQLMQTPLLSMQSLSQAIANPAATPSMPPANFEHWQYDRVIGVSRSTEPAANSNNDERLIAFYSGQALYAEENDRLDFNQELHVREYAREASPAAAPFQIVRTLRAPAGVYFRRSQTMQLDGPIVMQEDHSLIEGSHMQWDMRSGKIVLEQTRSFLEVDPPNRH